MASACFINRPLVIDVNWIVERLEHNPPDRRYRSGIWVSAARPILSTGCHVQAGVTTLGTSPRPIGMSPVN